MRVEIHELFKSFLNALEAKPRYSIVNSLAAPPKLGDFLDDLNPDLSLDWSGESFQGLPSLREKVVERMQYDLSFEQVLVTAGTAEANFLAISQLLVPGDEMIVDVPGWPQPLALGDALKIDVKLLRRKEDQNWSINLDELEELVTPKTKLIFICHPNNPTGKTLAEWELVRIVEIASRVGAYVLCDEVYANLEWGETPPIPRVVNFYERGISTGSVSKVLGLQGLRTGWLVTRDSELVFQAMVAREDTSEIMNVMGEYIADLALEEGRFKTSIERARNYGSRHLKILDEFVQSTPELSWYRPEAGLIGLCRLDHSVSAQEFCSRLLKEPYRTFVMPGTAYGHAQHFRLGAGGDNTDQLISGLKQVGRCLSELEP